MEQKKINERIAMAMLRQCALVWELWMKNPNEGEFKFSEVWQGLSAKTRTRLDAKTGMVFLEPAVCQYPDVFDKKIVEIDGLECYRPDGAWSSVEMFFRTDERDPNMGFGCSYLLTNVFDVTRDFCMGNGCQSLMNKTVFGYTDGERWCRLPEVDGTQKAQKPRKATAAKKQAAKASFTNKSETIHEQPASRSRVTSEPTLADRLREALFKQLKQAA